MFVKGAKFPKWGPNFLGNMAPGGPNFLGNLARGGQIFGGAKFPVTPVENSQKKIPVQNSQKNPGREFTKTIFRSRNVSPTLSIVYQNPIR